jgi:hypothetical protein
MQMPFVRPRDARQSDILNLIMPNWKALQNVAKSAGRTAAAIAEQALFGVAVQALQKVVWDYLEPYVSKRKAHSMKAGEGHADFGAALAAKDRQQYNRALQSAIQTYSRSMSNELTKENFYATFWTGVAYAHLADEKNTNMYLSKAYRIGARILTSETARVALIHDESRGIDEPYHIAAVLDSIAPFIPEPLKDGL